MSDDAVMPMKFVGRLTGMNMQEIEALKEENKRLREALEDIREMSEFPGFAIIEDRKAVGSLLDIIHETAKQTLLKEE